MPKEYIGRDPQERGSIKVSWGRESSTIQLAVAGPVDWRWEPLQAWGAEHRRATPSVVTQLPLDLDNDLDWHFTFQHRSEINDLIRLLRKARDGAFGADA